MKITKLLNSVLIGTLMIAPLAQAKNTTIEKGNNRMSIEQTEKTEKALKAVEKEQSALLEKVNQGVLEAYEKVIEATKLLSQEGKENEAINALQIATGKFDVAMAANPELNQVAINASVTMSALITSPALMKTEIDAAIDLLKEYKVQAARELLEPLRDEMVITTAYLPMGTYPDAIKLATKYLVKGKKEDAIATLATTLSTLLVEKKTIPLAIVRTQSLLKTASELDKNKDKAQAHELLDAAYEQLEIATLLGYTDKESKAYEEMKAQIKAVKKEIDGKNAVEKMYDKVKASIKKLINKDS